ncbi:MAG: HEAT repeat domain-containing protein [Gammaproteobacteria bacterium]|nr:HEAT repeat domain-containing protein [Gammaproteobacteria bacterium]
MPLLIDSLRKVTLERKKFVLVQVRDIGGVVATESLLGELIACLSPDAASEVYGFACDALSELGAVAATPVVLTFLISGLQDRDAEVRRLACRVLCEFGAAAATPAVLTALISCLQDSDSEVRVLACGALGATMATPNILAILINGLQDRDAEVRRLACLVLCEFGAAAATPAVLAALISCLQDSDSEVRVFALNVLATLGAPAATPDMLAVLINGLQDNASVRSSTHRVFCEFGAAAATPAVLAALISYLQDSDPEVRTSAFDVLAALGATAATPEVLVAIICGLRDDNSYVRASAFDALGALGALDAAAVAPEVLATLISDLLDVYLRVRHSICIALKKQIQAAPHAVPWLGVAFEKLMRDLAVASDKRYHLLLLTQLTAKLPVPSWLPHLFTLLTAFESSDELYDFAPLLLVCLQTVEAKDIVLLWLAERLLEEEPPVTAIVAINTSEPLLCRLIRDNFSLSHAIQAYALQHYATLYGIQSSFPFPLLPFVLFAQTPTGHYPVRRLNHQGQFIPDCTVYLSEQEMKVLLVSVSKGQENIGLPLPLALFSSQEENALQSALNPTTAPEKELRRKRKKNIPPPMTQFIFPHTPAFNFKAQAKKININKMSAIAHQSIHSSTSQLGETMQNSNYPESKQASKAKKKSHKESVSSNSSGQHKHQEKPNIQPEKTSSGANVALLESPNMLSKEADVLARQMALPARCEDKPYLTCVKIAAYLQQLKINKEFTPVLNAEYKLLEAQLLHFIPEVPLSPPTYGDFVTLVLIGNSHITKAVLERLYGLLQQNELDGEPLLGSIHQALAHILASGQPVNKDFLSPLIAYLLEKTLVLQNRGELNAAGVNQGLQSLYYLLTLLQQHCQGIRRELLKSLNENFAQLEKKLPKDTIKKHYPGYYFLLQQLQAQRRALEQYNKPVLDNAAIKKEKKTKLEKVILEPLKGTIQIATGATLLLSVISLAVLTSGITTFMIGLTAKISGDLAWKGLKRYGKAAGAAYDFYKLTAEEKQKASQALMQLCDNLDLERLLTLQNPSEAAEIVNQLSHFLCYYSLPQAHPLVGLVSSVLKKLYSTKFTSRSISASCDSTLQRFILQRSDSLSRAGYNAFAPLMDRNTGEPQLAVYASRLLSLPESTLTKYQSYTHCLPNEKERFLPQDEKEKRNFKRLKTLEKHMLSLTEKKAETSQMDEVIELQVNCEPCWHNAFPMEKDFLDAIRSLSDALINPPDSLTAKEQCRSQWKQYETHNVHLTHNRYPYSNWSQMLKAELDFLLNVSSAIQALLKTKLSVASPSSSSMIKAKDMTVQEQKNIEDEIILPPNVSIEDIIGTHKAIRHTQVDIAKRCQDEGVTLPSVVEAEEMNVTYQLNQKTKVGVPNPGSAFGQFAPRAASAPLDISNEKGVIYEKIQDNRHLIKFDHDELRLGKAKSALFQQIIKTQATDADGYIDNSLVMDEDDIISVAFKREKAAKNFEAMLCQEVCRIKAEASSSLLPQG